MPAADTVLLPLCVALTIVGLLITVLAWRKGRRGRVVQGLGLALAPVALYFTGLLRLVWDAVVAVVGWAARIVFSPVLWIGLSMLGLCVVLWVVGGLVARRTAPTVAKKEKSAVTAGPTATRGPAKVAAKPSKGAKGSKQAAADPEMDEIEALLKSHGID